MNQPDSHQDYSLHPTTVPADCQLSFRGQWEDQESNPRFREAVRQIVVGCGQCMDLSLLDGVTIGFDYDDALASVDLGYDSKVAKQYTRTDELIGVGKMLRVKRDGQLKAHIVLDASSLWALTDHSDELFWPTANILAHELAHVAVVAWFEEHSPGVMLAPHQGDWATAVLRDAAHALWEEYAACRLSARFTTGEVVTDSYVQALAISVDGAMSRARGSIKAFRTHGDVGRLLVESARACSTPLKMAAYLLGHLDGLDGEFDFNERCSTVVNSEFGPFLPELMDGLREAWERRRNWNGLEGLDGIVRVIVMALAAAGAIVTLNPAGSRVDAPFTAETMPNGEADMAIVRIRKQFGLD